MFMAFQYNLFKDCYWETLHSFRVHNLTKLRPTPFYSSRSFVHKEKQTTAWNHWNISNSLARAVVVWFIHFQWPEVIIDSGVQTQLACRSNAALKCCQRLLQLPEVLIPPSSRMALTLGFTVLYCSLAVTKRLQVCVIYPLQNTVIPPPPQRT